MLQVNVEMTDNFYESTVSVADPARIFSAVDWVSDSPLPLYLPTDLSSLPLPETRAKCTKMLKGLKGKKPIERQPAPSSADPLYNVFPWGINDPEEGNRTLEYHSKAADKIASPYGWHTIPLVNVPPGLDLPSTYAPAPSPNKLVNFTTTIGNNVLAQENYQGRNEYLANYRPDGGEAMNFSFVYDPQDAEDRDGRMKEARDHINATVTQLFYTTNMFHDLLYRRVLQPPSYLLESLTGLI